MTGREPILEGSTVCGIDRALLFHSQQVLSLLLFIVVDRSFFHADDYILAGSQL